MRFMAGDQEIICGDALSVLKTLPDDFVQTCVTSPPYWGLRDYGLEGIVWGGDDNCEHDWGDELYKKNRWTLDEHASDKQVSNRGSLWEMRQGKFCSKCGAWFGCLGLEPTPSLYVEHLVAVLREVKRVLRPDGTLWLNLGDSYVTSPPGKKESWDSSGLHGADSEKYQDTLEKSVCTVMDKGNIPGLKQKDLVGIPWRTAFALQDDGWYLRMDIIWSKPNPMPESIKDRPTKAHEYIFLMAKSERYYYDIDAIREPMSEATLERDKYPFKSAFKGQFKGTPGEERWQDGRPIEEPTFFSPVGRNKRSVWTVPTKPFTDAHFATFPPDLIEPCILAGSSDQSCSKCGAPYKRIVETEDPEGYKDEDWDGYKEEHKDYNETSFGKSEHSRHPTQIFAATLGKKRATVGWEPTCDCGEEETQPSIVMDIFSGSGTTGLVAIKNRRRFIGIELNPEYIEIAEKRSGEIQIGLF